MTGPDQVRDDELAAGDDPAAGSGLRGAHPLLHPEPAAVARLRQRIADLHLANIDLERRERVAVDALRNDPLMPAVKRVLLLTADSPGAPGELAAMLESHVAELIARIGDLLAANTALIARERAARQQLRAARGALLVVASGLGEIGE